jgi:hypothetical protein
MAALIGMPRAAWKRQPQGPMEIDYAYFNTQQVDIFCLGVHLSDLRRSLTFTLNNGAYIGSDQGRRSLITTATNQNATSAQNLRIYETGSSKSVLVNFVPHSLTGSFEYCLHSTIGIAIKHSSISNQWGSVSPITGSGEVLTARKEYTLMISINGTAGSYFSNGKKLSGAVTYNDFFGEKPLILGNHTLGGIGSPGSLALVVFCNRDLGPIGEQITANPWRIFKAKNTCFYSFPSAATAPGVPTSLNNQNLAATSFRSAWTAPA